MDDASTDPYGKRRDPGKCCPRLHRTRGTREFCDSNDVGLHMAPYGSRTRFFLKGSILIRHRPPLLVPAMHVHLLGCKSDNHLTRRLAFNKLEMCMTVMRELQKTHTSASIFCGVFGEAIRQLLPGPFDESIWGVAQTRLSIAGDATQESAEVASAFDSALQPIVTDDVLESLLNETSVYNFWESLNMPDQALATFDRQWL